MEVVLKIPVSDQTKWKLQDLPSPFTTDLCHFYSYVLHPASLMKVSCFCLFLLSSILSDFCFIHMQVCCLSVFTAYNSYSPLQILPTKKY